MREVLQCFPEYFSNSTSHSLGPVLYIAIVEDKSYSVGGDTRNGAFIVLSLKQPQYFEARSSSRKCQLTLAVWRRTVTGANSCSNSVRRGLDGGNGS